VARWSVAVFGVARLWLVRWSRASGSVYWFAASGVSCSVLPACSDTGRVDPVQPVSLPLTAAESWAIAPLEGDPFSEYMDGRVRCSPFALRREANWLEVSTVECNYASLLHQLSEDVPAGSIIRGQVAWATLASLAPAVGTLAFATSDGVLWSRDVDIPGQADIVEVEFAFSHPAPAGTGLYFHVRNHGYNTWQLGPLTLDGYPDR
jgi:hypothetical protein